MQAGGRGTHSPPPTPGLPTPESRGQGQTGPTAPAGRARPPGAASGRSGPEPQAEGGSQAPGVNGWREEPLRQEGLPSDTAASPPALRARLVDMPPPPGRLWTPQPPPGTSQTSRTPRCPPQQTQDPGVHPLPVRAPLTAHAPTGSSRGQCDAFQQPRGTRRPCEPHQGQRSVKCGRIPPSPPWPVAALWTPAVMEGRAMG